MERAGSPPLPGSSELSLSPAPLAEQQAEGGTCHVIVSRTQEGRLGPGPPCPGGRRGEAAPVEAVAGGLSPPEPSAQRSMERPRSTCCWPGKGEGVQGGGPTSGTQESWARPRKSSLPFLLVLGTMPCRASSVAIPSCTRVQMPFFGLVGPALAGSRHCGARLGPSKPLWHFWSPTGHALGRKSVQTERAGRRLPTGQLPADPFPTAVLRANKHLWSTYCMPDAHLSA